jgi:phenylalanyl-tRNA synthetase beta subunit
VFQRLQFSYKEESGVFSVVVPFERLDIEIPEDLVEEVGRIIGYDKIPAKNLPGINLKPELNPTFYWSEKVREDVTAKGYSEVYTGVFANAGEEVVLNKVDGTKPYLRSTLLDNLKEALQKNIPNKYLLGLPEIKLFEIGTVWRGGKEEVVVGTIGEKEEAKEVLLSTLQKPFDQWSHYEELALSRAARYVPFSKYPYIVRDIAVWVPAGTQPESVLQGIQKEAGELCVKADIFDTFQKEGKMSLAFRLIFQSFDRTLTEVEVNAIMDKVYAAFKAKGFEIR